MFTYRMFTILCLCCQFIDRAAIVAQEQAGHPTGCIAVTKRGHKLSITRFTKITNGMAEYEYAGTLHDLWVSEIRKITCDGRAYEILKDSLRPVLAHTEEAALPSKYGRAGIEPPDQSVLKEVTMYKKPVPSDVKSVTDPTFASLEDEDPIITSNERPGQPKSILQDWISASIGHIPNSIIVTDSSMFLKGTLDARKYYDPVGAGLLSIWLAPTLIGPPVIATITPRPKDRNPNSLLYYTNDDYHRAYDRSARKRKNRAVVIGFSFGLLLYTGFIAGG